jgi:transcriptional regulator with XRE-family HTH domain
MGSAAASARGSIQQVVGENVRRLRERRGWTQDQLAEASGIHPTYISGIERARRNATLAVVARLAEALRVDPARLLRHPHDA